MDIKVTAQIIEAFSCVVGVWILNVIRKQNNSSNMKVDVLCTAIDTICNTNNGTIGALVKAMSAQDATIDTLRKEKELLEKQLNEATDALAEIDNEVTGEDDEEEDDGPIAVKRTATATSEDKLHVIRALLADAVAKKEQINPANLLGIVDLRTEEAA